MSETKLDANGNPIVEEETITVSKKQYDEIVEKLANETQSKTNLVSEIQELRKKKQDVIPSEITPEKIAEIATDAVSKVYQAKEAEVVKLNQESALKAFLQRNKAFHPDNDAGNVKMEAFKKELTGFNLGNAKTEEDFLHFYSKAARLVGVEPEIRREAQAVYQHAPANGGSYIKEVDNDGSLSDKEMKYVNEKLAGDKNRWLEMKKKRPEFAESLMQYYR